MALAGLSPVWLAGLESGSVPGAAAPPRGMGVYATRVLGRTGMVYGGARRLDSIFRWISASTRLRWSSHSSRACLISAAAQAPKNLM